jgi:hypothetical protein
MKELGECLREMREDKIRRDVINDKFISYFKEMASYCTTKQETLELFLVWIADKGVLRTFDKSVDVDNYLNEHIDSFYKQFHLNNKLGDKILLSKEAYRSFFLINNKVYSHIYDVMKNEGYIMEKDNLGNRYNPHKAKWFNDLPSNEQLDIEEEGKSEREEKIKRLNFLIDNNPALAKILKGNN